MAATQRNPKFGDGNVRPTSRRPTRGYSRDFTPNKETEKRYLLDHIPAPLWRRVSDKCKRDGVSRRAVILRLLTDWSES